MDKIIIKGIWVLIWIAGIVWFSGQLHSVSNSTLDIDGYKTGAYVFMELASVAGLIYSCYALVMLIKNKK
ncbi:MAG: hypothetical protein HPAVJP_5000 [Candidatus Hepatoplasma vulgare]|nr:MAG: hypothetical protein HPAVJP_5000 [Candidatus Hepatoplasma sp.]